MVGTSIKQPRNKKCVYRWISNEDKIQKGNKAAKRIGSGFTAMLRRKCSKNLRNFEAKALSKALVVSHPIESADV